MPQYSIRTFVIARRRRGRIGKVDDRKLAAVEKLERTHEGPVSSCRVGARRPQAGSAAMIRQAFCPPKPNELDSTVATFCLRAWLGTTSRLMVGSGTL